MLRLTRLVLAATLVPALAAAQAPAPARPASLGLQANITFLYYRDIPRAQRFYEDVLGLTLTVDQGYSKIYRVSATSYVGLVDESQGLHRASPQKPVTLSFVTAEVDAWYAYLRGRGVEMVHELADGRRQPTRGFVAKDPEGYYLEFETFRDDPQNATVRAQLALAPTAAQRDAMTWVDGLLRRYVGQFAPTAQHPAGWTPERIIERDLTPELRAALAADRAAAVANPGEIVGLDFDPFVAAQDFCDAGYAARATSSRGDSVYVAVHADCEWGQPLVPDVVYVLLRRDGRWLVADLQFPGQTSLLRLLKSLADERAKPR